MNTYAGINVILINISFILHFLVRDFLFFLMEALSVIASLTLCLLNVVDK